MNNKKTYEKIEGLQEQVSEQMAKIEKEFQKEFSNYEDIHHWQAEINVWQEMISQLLKSIGRG